MSLQGLKIMVIVDIMHMMSHPHNVSAAHRNDQKDSKNRRQR